MAKRPYVSNFDRASYDVKQGMYFASGRGWVRVLRVHAQLRAPRPNLGGSRSPGGSEGGQGDLPRKSPRGVAGGRELVEVLGFLAIAKKGPIFLNRKPRLAMGILLQESVCIWQFFNAFSTWLSASEDPLRNTRCSDVSWGTLLRVPSGLLVLEDA